MEWFSTCDKNDEELIKQLMDSGCKNKNFVLPTGESQKVQFLWEAKLYDYLNQHYGRDLIREEKVTDFCLDRSGQKIWIEATAPEIPAISFSNSDGILPENYSDECILKWISAVREKGICKYHGQYKIGMGEQDVFIIAISNITSANSPMSFSGVDEKSYAISVAFGLRGSVAMKTGIIALQVPAIEKRNGSQVGVGVFLKDEYKHVSGILALDVTCGRIVFIHNHNAVNPLTEKFFPASEEWVCDKGKQQLVNILHVSE